MAAYMESQEAEVLGKADKLEKGGFRTTVSDGLWAAYRRSLELGGNDSNVGPDRNKR